MACACAAADTVGDLPSRSASKRRDAWVRAASGGPVWSPATAGRTPSDAAGPAGARCAAPDGSYSSSTGASRSPTAEPVGCASTWCGSRSGEVTAAPARAGSGRRRLDPSVTGSGHEASAGALSRHSQTGQSVLTVTRRPRRVPPCAARPRRADRYCPRS